MLAYDADEVHGTHFFSMEYVEGQDLARFVVKHGPLPWGQACDYIRQAALGLQHAHECGLVHRDIKPHNLLLTARGGVVKIMDMGLARLDHVSEDSATSGTMTREGTVMGTLDYIAPEQALNSHAVDIRADLYSLGCTLFFLLTGRVPFAGGTATQKLLRHQLEAPPPLTRFRPDLSAELAAVVVRLLAKRPEDRYGTPAELAAALSVLNGGASLFPVGAGERTTALDAPAGNAAPTEDLATAALDFRPTAESVEASRTEPRQRRRAEKRLLLALAVGVLLLASAVGMLIVRGRSNPSPKGSGVGDKTAGPKEDAASASERWRRAVAEMLAEDQVEAVARELKKRNAGFDGLMNPTYKNGFVVGLSFSTRKIKDLSPLSALRSLTEVTISGQGDEGQALDLLALKGHAVVLAGLQRQPC